RFSPSAATSFELPAPTGLHACRLGERGRRLAHSGGLRLRPRAPMGARPRARVLRRDRDAPLVAASRPGAAPSPREEAEGPLRASNLGAQPPAPAPRLPRCGAALSALPLGTDP